MVVVERRLHARPKGTVVSIFGMQKQLVLRVLPTRTGLT